MFDIVDLINIIERNNSLHICIQPIVGTDNRSIILPHAHYTHSKNFCSVAKSNDLGLKTCMEAKAKAIEKALKGEDYSGYCVCGLFEYVRPVKISGKIRYIIYLGNILKDQDIARQKISAVVGKTGVSKDSLLKELSNAEPFFNEQEYLKILDLLEFHIKRFHEESRQLPPHRNFIVDLLKDFIEKNYDKNFSILDFSKTHRVNAKYLGRLYKAQEGVTVTEHLNAFRLEKAAKQLKNTDTKIIEIALSVGFSNIGYFNRIFKNKFGVTPKEYRASK